MDSRGNVRMFDSEQEAIKAGYIIPVHERDLTAEQKRRLELNDQPVVRANDHVSTLAKLRDKAKKNCKACCGRGYLKKYNNTQDKTGHIETCFCIKD